MQSPRSLNFGFIGVGVLGRDLAWQSPLAIRLEVQEVQKVQVDQEADYVESLICNLGNLLLWCCLLF